MAQTMSPQRPRIAVFAGPDATVLNTQPLVTSDKARVRAGLPPRTGTDDRPARFDALRPQRLAAPATLYVEQHSAHPLEGDAAALSGPPDGFIGPDGIFARVRTSDEDVPVYEIRLDPEDGLYPLPYMGLQADGRAWDGDESEPMGPPERARQPFYPDAERLFEEIDRLGVGDDGLGGQLARLADYDFQRPAPPAGHRRSGERPGYDYWAYRPRHLIRQPARPVLADITNSVVETLASAEYAGAIWLEGSPYLEETSYWFSLLLDTPIPLVGCAAQRPHGALGDDGAHNILDAVRYLVSDVWADESGRDGLGPVVIVDQRIMAARTVQKQDARPGGYVVTGGHGGVLGSISSVGRPVVSLRPAWRHTWSSELRLGSLPDSVAGLRPPGQAAAERPRVMVRDAAGRLAREAIPDVALIKHGQYVEDDPEIDAGREEGILGHVDRSRRSGCLAGFVAEGAAPYAGIHESGEAALRSAVLGGLPVVKVGRGNADGLTDRSYAPLAIAGGNLSATKARMLLMASMLKLGALPIASDPQRPTGAEIGATRRALDAYQLIFDEH